MANKTQEESVFVGWLQFAITIAGAVAGIILCVFTWFPTKESVATQFDLRSRARDTEISMLRQDLNELKEQQKETNRILNQMLMRMQR